MDHTTTVLFLVVQHSLRKGVSVKCAAPTVNKHEPIVTFDARSRTDEAKAIVLMRFPFKTMRWRRGSGPLAAELPVTAARPSMGGPSGIGGLALGLSSFPCTLSRPSQETRFEL